MKCAKCGAEIKEGCIYCSVCGNAVQIVPDYSVLEDDYLRSLLKEEESAGKEPAPAQAKQQKPKQPQRKKNRRLPFLIGGILLVLLVLAGILIKVAIDHRNANSYDYQMEQAAMAADAQNDGEALDYYERALYLYPNDITAREKMIEIYEKQKNTDAAMVLLIEIIKLDPANEDAYRDLIAIYDAREDYDSILDLEAEVDAEDLKNKDKILDLFADYMISAPLITDPEGDVPSGKYDEALEVEIASTDGDAIYYTINGDENELDAKTGTRYFVGNPLVFDESGKYTIAAVCRNDKGIYSSVTYADFEIELAPPDFAEVSPDGGRFYEPTLVTLTAEDGCSIYYTWDGTDPTTASARYTEPFEVPEGNNVLSVLVVDNTTGLDSGVYRANFIYYL